MYPYEPRVYENTTNSFAREIFSAVGNFAWRVLHTSESVI
jgi:hypothetical protein